MINLKNNLTKKNLTFSIISLVISTLQSLWYISFVTRIMGNEVYGYSAVVSSFVNIATVLSVAVTSMSSRFISIHLKRNHIKEANNYFNSLQMMTKIVGIIIFIFFMLLSIFTDSVMNVRVDFVNDVSIAILVSGLTLIFSILSAPFLSAIYYANYVWIYYFFVSLSNIAKIIFPIMFYMAGNFHIWSMPLGALVIEVISYIFYHISYCKFVPELVRDKKFFSLNNCISILKSGIWVSITKAGALLQSSINSYLSNIMVSAILSGVYSTLMQFQSLVNMLSTLLTSCFTPNMYKIYAIDGEKGLYRYSNKIMWLINICIGIICGLLLSYGMEFINLWLNDNYNNYLPLFYMIIYILPVSVFSEVLNQILITLNKNKGSAIITLLIGLFSIITAYLFTVIFQMSIYGIALSQFFSLLLKSVFCFPIYTSSNLHIKVINIHKTMIFGPIITFIVLVVCHIVKLLLKSIGMDGLIFFIFGVIVSLMLSTLIIATLFRKKIKIILVDLINK